MRLVKIGNKTKKGIVSYISKTSDPTTRSFTIQVRVENKENKILSGLSSEIIIDGPSR